MSNLNACRKLASGNIATGKGRLIYPNLLAPSLMKGETDESKAKYGTSILLPKGTDVAALKEAIQEKLEDELGAKWREKKAKLPILKTEDYPKLAAYADEFPVMLRASSKDKPGIVFANGSVCNDPEAVYGGRWAIISLRPFFYDHPTGGKGVSLGLQNVQLLDHADPMGSQRVRAEDEFAPIEDDML